MILLMKACQLSLWFVEGALHMINGKKREVGKEEKRKAAERLEL